MNEGMARVVRESKPKKLNIVPAGVTNRRKVHGHQLRSENWNPTHTRILLMAQEGKGTNEIAKETGLAIGSITNIKNSPCFQQRLAAFNYKIVEKVVEKRSSQIATSEARELLNQAAVAAAQTVIKLAARGMPEDRVKLLACQDILDRAGLRPIEIIETRERVYSPEEIVHARAVLAETEDIIKRLSNQTNPFVFDPSKGPRQGLASSATDQAQDALIREES